MVPIKEILYMEKSGRTVHVHTDDEVYVHYAKFDDIMPELDSRFSNCHRSYILNMDRIKYLGKMKVRMDDSSELVFGKTTFQRLKREVESFTEWKRKILDEIDRKMGHKK